MYANTARGKSLKMHYLSPEKPWNLTVKDYEFWNTFAEVTVIIKVA